MTERGNDSRIIEAEGKCGEAACFPKTTMKSGKQGQKRIKPRLVKGQGGSIEVQNMLRYSPVLRDQPWTEYCVREGDKGPMIWEIKECEIFIRKSTHGVPSEKPLRLILAHNVLNEDEKEIKYFVSNASKEVPLDDLLLAAFSRWRVERSFQNSKQKLGLGSLRRQKLHRLDSTFIVVFADLLFFANAMA